MSHTSAVEYQDVKVRFLGQVNFNSSNDEKAELSTFLHDKIGKKEYMHGFSKDMVLSLKPAQGMFTAIPKSGGQALSLKLSAVESMAVSGTKFAFVVSAKEEAVRTLYGFQFKKKQDADPNGFLAAFEKGSHVEQLAEMQMPRGRKMSFSTASRNPSQRAVVEVSAGSSTRVVALEEEVDDLKKKLTEAEVALLNADLLRANAEKATEEARKQVEVMRKEMALAAADMSSELAQMKMDFSEERASSIAQEIQLIKGALTIIEANQGASKGDLWQRVLDGDVQPSPVTNGSATATEGSNSRLLRIAKRVSHAAIQSNMSETEDMITGMSRDELLQLVYKQRDEILALRGQADLASSLQAQLVTARRTNTQTEAKLAESIRELRDLESEKQLLADTISSMKSKGQHRSGPKPSASRTLLPSPTSSFTQTQSKIPSAATLPKPSSSAFHAQPALAPPPVSQTNSHVHLDQMLEQLADDNYSDIQDGRDSSAAEIIEKIVLAKVDGAMGLSIAGGVGDEVDGQDNAVYITDIVDGKAAAIDGRFRVGDKILEVDGQSLENISHEQAVDIMRHTGQAVTFLISRVDLDGQNNVEPARVLSPVENAASTIISTEMEEVEETLHIEFQRVNAGLGFSIAGGTDDPVDDGDTGVYVTAVTEGGAAFLDGRLTTGDRILSVNGVSMEDVTHEEAVRMLSSQGETIRMSIARVFVQPAPSLPEGEEVFEVTLTKAPEESFGFSIAGGTDLPVADNDTGMYITHIVKDGVADHNGQLEVGDRILEINGEDMSNCVHDAAAHAIRMNPTAAHIIVSRLVSQEELIEIEFPRGEEGLGFSIAGGIDGEDDLDDGIYIMEVIEGGAASKDGRLQRLDKLLEINGEPVEGITHDQAVGLLQKDSDKVRLLVSRLVDAPFGDETLQGQVMDIELEGTPEQGLGFSMAGGADDPIEEGNDGFYVSDVTPDGPAYVDARLKFGDRILAVNGQSLDGMTHQEAVDVLQAAEGTVMLTIVSSPIEQNENGEIEIAVELEKVNGSLGFSIAGGKDDPVEEGNYAIFITGIIPDGAAAKNGMLLHGDKLLTVNGTDVTETTHDECVALLQEDPEKVTLVVARLPYDDETLDPILE
eukprot:m.360136 g.360136  ORF g.360136 m.360136 type:complete len:1113 (+) comp18903_c0_seq1:282-3620(+)